MSRAATPADVIAGAARYAVAHGDCRTALAQIPDGIAQTCVTSPPYYGLRDYGTASWEGGDPACDHVIDAATLHTSFAAASTIAGTTTRQKDAAVARLSRNGCPRCGARRVDSQIGLEQTPAEYVAQIVAVMREVRRVLRDDGTAWLNLGDSYNSGSSVGLGGSTITGGQTNQRASNRHGRGMVDGLKPKDLLGIPWRVAFALQDDGWWLRSDIVWSKPNPMPESVTDRPTRAHEYVFLLTKSARYFYDADAVRERASGRSSGNVAPDKSGNAPGFEIRAGFHKVGDVEWHERNARSVWTITPEPYAGAHFATMPPELARRCILAGSRKGDVVLDPFNGAGTTGLVALGHHRRYVGTELNAEYIALTHERLAALDGLDVPMRSRAADVVQGDARQLSLLGGAQ